MERIPQFTSTVITLKPQDSIYDALLIMKKNKIRQIVVSSNQTPEGIVTDRNIAKFLKNYEPKKSPDAILLSEIEKNVVIIFADRENIFHRCSVQMNLFNASSVIAVDDHRQLCGIITKSDIVRIFSKIYKGENKVKDHMTNSVITCKSDDTLGYALQLLDEKNIGRLVVLNKDKQPEGIITYSTILRKTDLFEPLGETNMYTAVLVQDFVSVKDLMTQDLITINTDDSIVKAAELLSKHNISGLPVIDKLGKLSGMISSSDIVRIYEEEFKNG